MKLKINSDSKLEGLLQEIYDDVTRNINLIQDKITEFEQSSNLSDAPIDAKAKYAKAIHDYLTDKDKAISKKLEVSKIMSEIIKNKGDVKKVLDDMEIAGNFDDEFKKIRDEMTISENVESETENYITNKFKH